MGKVKKMKDWEADNEGLTILKIVKKYDSLKLGLKHIILTNKSNYGPYHDLNHLLTVTYHTYKALSYMDMLDDENVETLLLTALFHDTNHSMGKKSDDLNIKASKKYLGDFVKSNGLELDKELSDSILDATQFPYVIEDKDLDVYQKIIRDADMCQIFEYNWIGQNILGLVKEIGTDVTGFLPNQGKFLDSIKFYTSYGKSLKSSKFKGVVSEHKILEDVMSSKNKLK